MAKVKEALDAAQRYVDPFGKDVANEELLKHQQLTELQIMMNASIETKTGMLITGPAGSGKTTAARSVTDELPSHKYTVAYLGQDREGGNVLRRFVGKLGLPAKRFHSQLSLQVSQWLLDNLEAGGKEIALIVDEARMLPDELLEDLRLMMNAEYDRKSPLALVLLGHQELRLRLKSPNLEALSQRLRYRFRLEGLDQEETSQYIEKRLKCAGISGETFSQEAVQYVFQLSEGLPRRVNNICSLALLRAKATRRAVVDLALLKELDELD